MTGKGLIIRGSIGMQHGRKIVSGFVSAKKLAEMYERGFLKIDEYSLENPNGYQREHSLTRARKFARFAARTDGISPENILIYSRDAFDPVEKEGKIELPDSLSMYIVDGQHRTVGFSEAFKMSLMEDDDYDALVSILFWNPEMSTNDQRLEEAMQFFTINTQQKRPRTDLAHQYIYQQTQSKNGPIGVDTRLPMNVKKKDYVPFEIYVAEQLYKDGSWKKRITPPNGHENAPISQGSFTDSLTPVMDYSQNAGLKLGETIQLLNNYWGAIFELCSDAYENWDNYLLMKTPGIYSLHIFLPTLIARRRNLAAVATKQQFKEVLKQLPEHFSDSFWNSSTGEASKFGGGKKAFTEISQDIVDELDQR